MVRNIHTAIFSFPANKSVILEHPIDHHSKEKEIVDVILNHQCIKKIIINALDFSSI